MAKQCYRCRGYNMRSASNGGLYCPDCGHQWQPNASFREPEPARRVINPGVAVAIGATVVVIGLCIAIAVMALTTKTDNDSTYRNCDQAVVAEGRGNFPTNHPAYSPWLDGDDDGIACERW